MRNFNLREFLTKPRVEKQFGSFPLYFPLRGERLQLGTIQGMTAVFCAFGFMSALLPQLSDGRLEWPYVVLMVLAVGAVVAQQLYYTRKGQNYFQLVRGQYRHDKERIAYLKEHGRG